MNFWLTLLIVCVIAEEKYKEEYVTLISYLWLPVTNSVGPENFQRSLLALTFLILKALFLHCPFLAVAEMVRVRLKPQECRKSHFKRVKRIHQLT